MWVLSAGEDATKPSCDPGQAAVTVYINTWLFADVCLAPSLPAPDETGSDEVKKLTETACVSCAIWSRFFAFTKNSCCSAFHSSVVKVPVEVSHAYFSVVNFRQL